MSIQKKDKLVISFISLVLLITITMLILLSDSRFSMIDVKTVEDLNQLSDIELVSENNDFIQLSALNEKSEDVRFVIDKKQEELYKASFLMASKHSTLLTTKNLILSGIFILLFFTIVYFIMKQKKAIDKEDIEKVEKATVQTSSSSKDGNFELTYSDISFKDVAGYEYAKEELQEIIDQLKNPSVYKELGANMVKGGVFFGPPGTGKTFLAKALAGESGVPFISVSGTDFVQEFVGRGANRIRELFEFAKEHSPCIIFIDEIDAVGAKRSGDANTKEWDNTVNAILVELDGFKNKDHHIVVLGATNKLEVLDDALLRPGRLDRKIEIGKPDYDTRLHILKHLTTAKNRKFHQDCDLENLSQMTYNFSAAELEQVVNEAILLSARKKLTTVSDTELREAFDKVTIGISSKKKLSQMDKKTVAYHEAGHAVITSLLKPDEIIQKVTILPQGQSLGFVSKTPKNDIILHSKEYLEDEVKILLAGRVSEEIFIHTITTGAQNDFERATMIVNHMETQFGMFGNLVVKTNYQDNEVVNQKLKEYYSNLKTFIETNEDVKQKINVIANFLLKKEVLTGDELKNILLKVDERNLAKKQKNAG